MSLLDQFFVYHPEPWQDRDWARLSNGTGALGTGSRSGPEACVYDSPCSTTPVSVATSLIFTDLTAGGEGGSDPVDHTCGLTPTGMAYCWGIDLFGTLGVGTLGQGIVLTPAAVTGGLVFATIVAGADFTCGLSFAGMAYCWGGANEEWAQLGNGGNSQALTPTAVIGGLTFSAIAAGYATTCGLTPVGGAYCWGSNSFGQVGNGTTDSPVATPTIVSGQIAFAALTLGYDHSCGLTVGGVAYCWGNNQWGALGTGNTVSASSPVEVSGGLRFTAISAGGGYTCGLARSGLAYCWGFNDAGQLGDGTTNTALVPVPVAGGLTFRTQ